MSEEAIHGHLAGRLAAYKQLAGGVAFLQELPKNPTGKVLRKVLREMM